MRRIAPDQLKEALLDVVTEIEDDLALKKIGMDAYRYIVRRTPTHTGYLRSNWSMVVDGSPVSTLTKGRRRAKNSYAAPTMPEIAPKVGSVITLYNNAEYAEAVDRGTPKHKAQPMTVPTAQYIERQLKTVADAISRAKSNV